MSLRARIYLTLAPLLLLLAVLGGAGVVLIYRLGGRADAILRENYDSVRAMERLGEAVERIDSSFQFAMLGKEKDARDAYDANWDLFDEQFAIVAWRTRWWHRIVIHRGLAGEFERQLAGGKGESQLRVFRRGALARLRPPGGFARQAHGIRGAEIATVVVDERRRQFSRGREPGHDHAPDKAARSGDQRYEMFAHDAG